MKKVLVLYTNAGHGHKKAAEAIVEAFQAEAQDRVQVEAADALDYTNRLSGYCYPRLYFGLVRWFPALWGWLFEVTNKPSFYRRLEGIRARWNYVQSAPLRKYLLEGGFDLIITTHFFPTQVSGRLRKEGVLRAKVMTVVTDVIPHRFWYHSGSDFYWVMSQESKDELLNMGCRPEKIETGGIPISMRFSAPRDRETVQKEFNFESGRFTILFSSGSFGLGPTEEILRSLRPLEARIQVAVVCGNNERLYAELQRNAYPFPIKIFGFTDRMQDLMAAADLLIAKAGGITMCESLAMRLPMLLSDSIPGQEAGNEAWLLASGGAVKLGSPAQGRAIAEPFLDNPDLLAKMKQAIDRIRKPNAASDLVSRVLSWN